MVLKNQTILSKEEAYNTLLSDTKKSYISKFIFLGVLGIVCTLILILSITDNSSDSLIMGFIFLFFFIMILTYYLYGFFTIPKFIKKHNEAVLKYGMINNFTFKEESFILAVTIGEKTTKIQLDYKELYKIVETDDKIIFMLTSTDSYICKKNSFMLPKELELFFYGLSKHKTKIKKKLSKPKN